jgi:hypothetical protein
LVSSAVPMGSSEDTTGVDMMVMMEDGANNNNSSMAMDNDNTSPMASMDMPDDSIASEVTSDEPPRTTSDAPL